MICTYFGDNLWSDEIDQIEFPNGVIDTDNYDGEDGRMDVWNLYSNSRTSDDEICLTDVLEDPCWRFDSYNNEQLINMILVGQVFCDIGFDVCYIFVCGYRKGYDYEFFFFEKNNPNKIMDLFLNKESKYKRNECFRIYIRKKY
jgi:hypothetical protein